MSDMSAASSRANRRLSARVACRLAMSYKLGADWHPATGMDLSNTGCRLRLGEDLPRGGVQVRIEQVMGDERRRAELEGQVIWTRLEGLSYQAGIQFTNDDATLHLILDSLTAPAPAEP
jgi:hypothetical protein